MGTVQETGRAIPSYEVIGNDVGRYLDRSVSWTVDIGGALTPEEAQALVCELAPPNLLDGDGWASHVRTQFELVARVEEADRQPVKARYTWVADATEWDPVDLTPRTTETEVSYILNGDDIFTSVIGDDDVFDHTTDCLQVRRDQAPARSLPTVNWESETRTRIDVIQVLLGDVSDAALQGVVCAVLPRTMPEDSATIETIYLIDFYRNMADYERMRQARDDNTTDDRVASYDWGSANPSSGTVVNNASGKAVTSFSHIDGCD